MTSLPAELFNYRDLGGHALHVDGMPGGHLRTGLLYRSNAVVGLPPDVADGLGLLTAIDLREPGEKTAEPATVGRARVHELEIVAADPDVPFTLRPFTHWLVESRGRAFAEAVRLLAAEPLPAVIFCSSGKDRTGVLAGLLQSALGVEDAAVVEDYAETERRMPAGYLSLALERSRRAGLPMDEPLQEFGSPPDLMATVLVGVRQRHGSAAQYLYDHGLAPADLTRLRNRLMEDHVTDMNGREQR
jgi:protein-tyrosine phosphatase